MVAAALIDRLVHHATMVTLKGKSYRLRERGTGPDPAGRKHTPRPNHCPFPRKATLFRRPCLSSRLRHPAPLAYGSLRGKPPQPSSGLLFSRRVVRFSVPETGALFGSC